MWPIASFYFRHILLNRVALTPPPNNIDAFKPSYINKWLGLSMDMFALAAAGTQLCQDCCCTVSAGACR